MSLSIDDMLSRDENSIIGSQIFETDIDDIDLGHSCDFLIEKVEIMDDFHDDFSSVHIPNKGIMKLLRGCDSAIFFLFFAVCFLSTGITHPSLVPTTTAELEHSPSRFPGPFNFQLRFFDESGGRPVARAATYTYSQEVERLFVQMSQKIPFKFTIDETPPKESLLRIRARYTQPEYRSVSYNLLQLTCNRSSSVKLCVLEVKLQYCPYFNISQEPVVRCPNHRQEDADSHHSLHLIRCDHPGVIYEKDIMGHLSIVIPIQQCPEQNGTYLLHLELMCFSSCPGGLNRRPFEITFMLEGSGRIFGCDSIDTRVCACPGRDRTSAEKRLRGDVGKKRGRKKKVSLLTSFTQQDDDKIYTLQVQGATHYAILQQLVQGLGIGVGGEEKTSVKRSSSKEFAPEVLPAKRPKYRKKPIQEASFTVDQNNSDEDVQSGDTEPDSDQEEDSKKNTPQAQIQHAFLNMRLQEAVQAWLNALGLDIYSDTFLQNGFDDLDVIADLTPGDLDCLGILRRGHRKKLLLAANRLKSLLHQARIQQKDPHVQQLHKTLSITRTTFRQSLPSQD
eukprot:gene10758-2845_t